MRLLRRLLKPRTVGLLAVLLAAAPVHSILAATLPPLSLPSDFVIETIASGFENPVDVEFLPDGRMLVAEKRGKVWIVENRTKLAVPLVDLADEVHGLGDKGLLGMAVDGDTIFLLFAVDPIPGSPDENVNVVTVGRLVRYTIAGDAVEAASRRVLLGATPAEGIIICHASHSTGTLRIGRDGSVFAACGDGAHYDFIDAGQDVTAFDPACAETFGASNDVGAWRSQQLQSLAGKILRVDPETGLGLPTNPFFDGDPASPASRVWAKGFRNPFRFTLRPGADVPGVMYVGDVGLQNREEVNVMRGGENFGWPCYEGIQAQGAYPTVEPIKTNCAAVPTTAVTEPLFDYPDSSVGITTGHCVAGVAFYQGDTYPSKYRGACFVADYESHWIIALYVDANDTLILPVQTAIEKFADGIARPVDLEIDPATGDLLYVSLEARDGGPQKLGEVNRIRYLPGNKPPQVFASAAPLDGKAPLRVKFSSEGTNDIEGDAMTFEWDFGDGSPLSSELVPEHIYAAVGSYTATLTVRDSQGASGSAALTIRALSEPPQAAITSPSASLIFYGGEAVPFRADAFDAEDGEDLGFHWRVTLHHNEHTHPDWFVSTEREPVFVVESHGAAGEVFYYEVLLTVTDRSGLTVSSAVTIRPGTLLRGDGNSDGHFNISDPIGTLFHLFAGREATCALAMDVDASGAVEVTDAVRQLESLFLNGPLPEYPFPDCGVANNATFLPCATGCR